MTADLSGLATGTAALDEGGMTQISVEDSKFLGGDLEHTHLVKGLDYALLQKVGRCGALCLFPPPAQWPRRPSALGACVCYVCCGFECWLAPGCLPGLVAPGKSRGATACSPGARRLTRWAWRLRLCS